MLVIITLTMLNIGASRQVIRPTRRLIHIGLSQESRLMPIISTTIRLRHAGHAKESFAAPMKHAMARSGRAHHYARHINIYAFLAAKRAFSAFSPLYLSIGLSYCALDMAMAGEVKRAATY